MDWIGVIGTLSGVLLGGFLTYGISTKESQRQMRWQMVRLRQEKLEQLAGILGEIEQNHRKTMFALAMPEEFRQVLNKAGERPSTGRLTTLIEFYAPEIKSEKDALAECIDDFHKLMNKAVFTPPRSKLKRQELNADLMRSLLRGSALCQAMIAQLAAISERVTRESR